LYVAVNSKSSFLMLNQEGRSGLRVARAGRTGAMAAALRKVSIGGWTRCPYFQKAANVAAAMEHLYPT
jgi:hypothetical protein